MKRHVAVMLLLAFCFSGCYLGRTPRGKKIAYIGNGVLVGLGAITIIAAAGDHGNSGDEDGVTRVLTVGGVIAIVVGIAGIVINVSVKTEPVQPASPAQPAQPGVVATPSFMPI